MIMYFHYYLVILCLLHIPMIEIQCLYKADTYISLQLYFKIATFYDVPDLTEFTRQRFKIYQTFLQLVDCCLLQHHALKKTVVRYKYSYTSRKVCGCALDIFMCLHTHTHTHQINSSSLMITCAPDLIAKE